MDDLHEPFLPKEKVLKERIHIYNPFIIILIIILIIIFHITIKKNRIKKYMNNYISFPVHQFNQSKILRVKIKDIAAYNDVWRGHWCPYYNDRMEFLTPRINEFLQYIRSYKIPVIYISFAAEASMKYYPQRIFAQKYIHKSHSIFHNFTAYPNESYNEYIPGFVDECNGFSNSKFSHYRDNDFAKPIAISSRDLFVADFKEGVKVANSLKVKYLLLTGDHTNMCLMHIMIYCQKIGIIPILVKDLSDSAWTYNAQKLTLQSHSQSNSVVNNYIENKMGMTSISYDIISSFESSNLTIQKVRYSLNLRYCRIFKKLAGHISRMS